MRPFYLIKVSRRHAHETATLGLVVDDSCRIDAGWELLRSMFRNPIFWAVVLFVAEAALQIGGWQNTYVATALAALIVALLLLAVLESLWLPPAAMFTLGGLTA